LVLAATDPANPYGVALPWPVKGPQRAAGAYLVLLDGIPSLYLERGGRAVVTLRAYDGSWEAAAVEALGSLVADGHLRRLALERFDDELSPVLRSAGFVPSPRGLVRYG
jgi:ATP-dependent Lhr-like helicase